MEKLSGYQKLKKENEELRGDIYDLVMSPSNDPQHIITKMKWRQMFELESVIFTGKLSGGNGFERLIQDEEK